MKKLYDDKQLYTGERFRKGFWHTRIVGPYVVWCFEYYIKAGALLGPQPVMFETIIGIRDRS